jgi:hypothetical protein
MRSACSSRKTVSASSKEMPCLYWFERFFRSSHSNLKRAIRTVYVHQASVQGAIGQRQSRAAARGRHAQTGGKAHRGRSRAYKPRSRAWWITTPAVPSSDSLPPAAHRPCTVRGSLSGQRLSRRCAPPITSRLQRGAPGRENGLAPHIIISADGIALERTRGTPQANSALQQSVAVGRPAGSLWRLQLNACTLGRPKARALEVDDTDFEGTHVLEKVAAIGVVEEFFDAIDADDVERATALMKRAKLDAATIAVVVRKLEDGDAEHWCSAVAAARPTQPKPGTLERAELMRRPAVLALLAQIITVGGASVAVATMVKMAGGVSGLATPFSVWVLLPYFLVTGTIARRPSSGLLARATTTMGEIETREPATVRAFAGPMRTKRACAPKLRIARLFCPDASCGILRACQQPQNQVCRPSCSGRYCCRPEDCLEEAQSTPF